MKADHQFLDRFETEFGPVGRALGMLIRPTIIAPEGKTFVWGDWSAIEARTLPWLADSRSAEEKLDVFREVDRNPEADDVYKLNAADIYEKPVDEVDKEERQVGKVAELALGFGGSDGALIAMATNYGIYLGDNMRQHVIETWRAKNSWARTFWGRHTQNESYGLWGAFNQAIEQPDTIMQVGRVAYVYDRSYLGGTVFCALPDGRLLTYPSVKVRELEFEDDNGNKQKRTTLSYRRGYGYAGLWYGKLAENITQAAAASLLRRLLVRLEDQYAFWMPTVMHTHDEALTMVGDDAVEEAERVLKREMELNEEWSQGLPLAAEVSSCWYYSKAIA